LLPVLRLLQDVFRTFTKYRKFKKGKKTMPGTILVHGREWDKVDIASLRKLPLGTVVQVETQVMKEIAEARAQAYCPERNLKFELIEPVRQLIVKTR
jgi:hypothetical protein